MTVKATPASLRLDLGRADMLSAALHSLIGQAAALPHLDEARYAEALAGANSIMAEMGYDAITLAPAPEVPPGDPERHPTMDRWTLDTDGGPNTLLSCTGVEFPLTVKLSHEQFHTWVNAVVHETQALTMQASLGVVGADDARRLAVKINEALEAFGLPPLIDATGGPHGNA